MVLGEIEGGSVKPSCFSAVEAAKSLSKENSISLLLAGCGSSLREAAKYAASRHPSVSQVLQIYGRCCLLKMGFKFRVLGNKAFLEF